MITLLQILTFVALQTAFIWARYTVFRIDGATPAGARVVEASTVLCIFAGIALMASSPAGRFPFYALPLGLAGASAAMFAWALRGVRRHQLSAAFSDDFPEELLLTGAFAFVRNPFYLAYILAHAVPLAASRSAWALLPLSWMVLLYRHAVALEERKFLASPLADRWLCYAATTGRFLPHLMTKRKGQELPT